ncbi:putative glycoside hydrolase [Rosellinia necatrix]|uniref:Putative glycoside hydrolase n=1 Tax=Rosellinia necatrix TaxID=77044 RepID=A0A1S7UMI4_ROSNE|nr:putative glycoside hydrolase [Rosellinia necatrix]
MSQLPEGTLGDAVGVLIFTFICFFTNILLLWLFWISNERLGYITLVGYFSLLCTTSSIIQQIYNYTLWNDLLWQQLYYIKAHYQNADVIFNNGNFGFMRVLAIIRLYCYIVESSYLLAYCIAVTMAMYNFWATRRRGERIFTAVARIAPVVLAAITIGLLQTPAVQSSFAAYMVVANLQSVTSCAISIVLLSIVIRQYIQSKLAWKRVQTIDESGSFWSRLRNSSSSSSSKDQSTITPVYTAQGNVFDDNWVVARLSIAVVLISAFIVANVVTHLPQRDDVERDAKADAPDLGPERARSNIIGYIFGVTPGLAIWIVFGLTRDFRRIMYEKFMPRYWRRRGLMTTSPLEAPRGPIYGRHQADLARVDADAGLELDDMGNGSKRRALPDVTGAPLLVTKSTPRLAPSNMSVSTDEHVSV